MTTNRTRSMKKIYLDEILNADSPNMIKSIIYNSGAKCNFERTVFDKYAEHVLEICKQKAILKNIADHGREMRSRAYFINNEIFIDYSNYKYYFIIDGGTQ